ncbi:predicted protein [Histoplasma mississippiense (nom. inval.)]|uniref:predicted protein n=1 Tax=Ajellomyces capsulatus (strain NAm1 / WU24) TaxID=2059318 RepID=UPI000157CA40|nr:predicted protein [Histoplasma mississippiense (nom. inval.)]EDN09302.1 predicted protein [Histoplasma mississippiense (nom. inval.)]
MVKVYRHGYFDYKHWPTPDEFPNYPKVLDGGHGSVDDTPVGRRRVHYFRSGTTSPSSDQLKFTKCNGEVISKTTNTLLGWLKIRYAFKIVLRHLVASFLITAHRRPISVWAEYPLSPAAFMLVSSGHDVFHGTMNVEEVDCGLSSQEFDDLESHCRQDLGRTIFSVVSGDEENFQEYL